MNSPGSGAAGDVLLRPVRAGNAFEETVERLLQAIRLGVVGPGDRLPPERELAARLGISRVTLREAFRVLRQSGYVESSRGRYGGTFVAREIPRSPRQERDQLDSSVLEDVLTLRFVLETGTAEAAARRALSGTDEQHLRQCLYDTESSGYAAYRRCDSRLHLAIAEAAGSPSLTSAVADMRTRLNELLDAIPLLARNIDHSNSQHAMVVAAILADDPGSARRAMAEHVEGTASLLRGFLR